ncbi:MAG: hypothetical protein DI576_01185 [Actinomyces sp.]|nr:MAG: hypothetical protein DI576_01185 [Actinomyces sp.]
MRLYRRTIRVLFAAAFIGGGASHFLFGRLMPDSYAAFAGTALLPWLGDLWRSFVMPNIGRLTIALGLFEIACGAGILRRRTAALSAWAMFVFLALVTVLGYGWPAASPGEDLLKNRLSTIVLTLLLIPLLAKTRAARNPTTGY